MLARKTLEINPGHPIIKRMLEKVQEADNKDPEASIVELSDILFDTALLNSGFNVEDSTKFFEKVERMVRKGFEVDENEKIEEPYVNVTEDGNAYLLKISR